MLPERYEVRRISKIADDDRKVSVIGIVTELRNESFVLDDADGKIEVFFDKRFSDRIKEGMSVRGFCRIEEKKLNLDVLQDISGLDLNLLNTVEELYSRAGV